MLNTVVFNFLKKLIKHVQKIKKKFFLGYEETALNISSSPLFFEKNFETEKNFLFI